MLPTTTASKYLVLSYFDSLVNQLLAITWNLGRSPTSQMPVTSYSWAVKHASPWGWFLLNSPRSVRPLGPIMLAPLEEDDPNLQPPILHIMEAEPTSAPCGWPKRTQPPPTPTELPYPATKASLERLQEFLLDYYGSSTFNTCPHQRLPLMEAPPMRLMVDHSAQPVAHHQAIPVPLHWCDDVKAGLERDVQLGVLEPVPIGEPVTWCHRMVVSAVLWISRPSTYTPLGRPTISSLHSIRHALSLPTRRKLYLMHGMDTIVSPSTLMTATWPPSSLLGVGKATVWPLRAMSPPVMPTPGAMMS